MPERFETTQAIYYDHYQCHFESIDADFVTMKIPLHVDEELLLREYRLFRQLKEGWEDPEFSTLYGRWAQQNISAIEKISLSPKSLSSLATGLWLYDFARTSEEGAKRGNIRNTANAFLEKF